MKIKQQEAELKRKDAAERQKREQQQKDDEERIKQMQKQKKLDEEKKRLEEEKHKKQQQQQQNDDIFNRNKLNADEEEKKRKEKELLEEEDRKKRWISTNTVNNVKLSDEKEKNSLEKSKKDELLAKLALLDTGSNLNTNTNNDIIASTGLKQPKSDQNLLSFGSTNNNSSLPPKPFQFTNNNNNTEYKFTNTIENLHDGKPVSINREQSNSNKNDLLNKLFNNNNNSSNNNNNNDVDFSLNNNRYQQSKLDKIDDIFTNKTTHDKVKSNVMPWELDTVIKKQETNGFDHSSSLNRPKLDNKSLFNNNNNNDNYVEDIEELAL